MEDLPDDFLLKQMAESIEDWVRGKSLGPEYEGIESVPAGKAGWYALPLRAPLDELDEEVAARDVAAEGLGEWIVSSFTDEERKYFITTEWINCHEQ